MRISRGLILAAVAALGLASATAAGAGSEPRYRSVQEARDQGVSAFGNGYFEMAMDPLEYAAAQNDFLAQYYLARIYSDNSTTRTDHGKAYILYQRLADEYADIDPDDDRRAPFVAKALTALAGYLRSGLGEIGLNPDLARADEYLHHAATFFNDEDAQFQLAKVILEGSLRRNGQPRDEAREKLAIHWLSVLTTERRQPGAQALLAYLMWRGEHEPLVRKDPTRALALVTVAAENAPAAERTWVEDYYQEIYCGVASGGRKKLDGMVASYRQQYGQQAGRALDRRDRSALGGLQPEAARTCADGELVPPVKRQQAQQGQGMVSDAAREASQQSFARGAMGAAAAPATSSPALGLVGAGTSAPPPNARR